MYLFQPLFTLRSNNLPEQLPAPSNAAAGHMDQTHTVVQWLHVVGLHTRSYEVRMDERWKDFVTQHHQGIRFQGLEYEIGAPLRPTLRL